MKKLPFKKDELDLNKRGLLSANQISKIQLKLTKFFGLIIFFLIWTVFVFGFVFRDNIFLLVLTGSGLIMGLLTWAFFIWRRVKQGKGVRVVEGKAEFDIGYGGRDQNNLTPFYTVKVKDQKFPVEEELYDAISGERFRVYYFPAPPKVLLSYEVLEEDEDNPTIDLL